MASRRLEPAPRTIRGARDLLSVALQYGNAFGQGLQAAALKPADFFGNDDVLYLMEDMATGEIRLSILWEWLHKRATLTGDDSNGSKAARPSRTSCSLASWSRSTRSCSAPSNRDVYDVSKATTLPIAREIVETYVTSAVKLPWYIDLLNINLDNHDLAEAKQTDPRCSPRRFAATAPESRQTSTSSDCCGRKRRGRHAVRTSLSQQGRCGRFQTPDRWPSR